MSQGLLSRDKLYDTLCRWEARSKLLAFLLLMFAFSAVNQWLALVLMVLFAAALLYAAAISWRKLARRMRLPGLMFGLMGVMLLLLPQQGTVWLHIGPIRIMQEGATAFLYIGLRFICIVVVVTVLLETTRVLSLLHALRRLKAPAELVDMALFVYRYLYELERQFRTMLSAMRLRGFRGGPGSLRTYAALTGSMLLRSYDQAERIDHAMRLRGYGQPVTDTKPIRLQRFEKRWIMLFAGGGCILIAVQWLGA